MKRDPQETDPELSALREEVAEQAYSLVAEPERHYGSPAHLAWDVRLTRSQRIKALKAWYRRASNSLRHEQGNPSERQILDEIDAALRMTRAQEF